MDEFDYDAIDIGVREVVRAMRAAGIETFESCQGGHFCEDGYIRLQGDYWQALHALGIAAKHGLRVLDVALVQAVVNGMLETPAWTVRFIAAAAPSLDQGFLDPQNTERTQFNDWCGEHAPREGGA